MTVRTSLVTLAWDFFFPFEDFEFFGPTVFNLIIT
jgi:hypothetical protein